MKEAVSQQSIENIIGREYPIRASKEERSEIPADPLLKNTHAVTKIVKYTAPVVTSSIATALLDASLSQAFMVAATSFIGLAVTGATIDMGILEDDNKAVAEKISADKKLNVEPARPSMRDFTKSVMAELTDIGKVCRAIKPKRPKGPQIISLLFITMHLMCL